MNAWRGKTGGRPITARAARERASYGLLRYHDTAIAVMQVEWFFVATAGVGRMVRLRKR